MWRRGTLMKTALIPVANTHILTCQASLHFVQKNSHDLVFSLLAGGELVDRFPFCDRGQRKNLN